MIQRDLLIKGDKMLNLILSIVFSLVIIYLVKELREPLKDFTMMGQVENSFKMGSIIWILCMIAVDIIYLKCYFTVATIGLILIYSWREKK